MEVKSDETSREKHGSHSRDKRHRPSRFDDPGPQGDRDRSPPGHIASSKYTLQVSNLPFDFTWRDLKNLAIDKVGKQVKHADVFKGPQQGKGILIFFNESALNQAAMELSNYPVKDRKIYVNKVIEGNFNRSRDMSQSHNWNDPNHRGREEDDPPGYSSMYGLNGAFLDSLKISRPLGNTVLIMNLDFKVDKEKLKEVFSMAGEVRMVDLWTLPDGKSKGMATIEFDHPVEAVQAISMFDKQMLYERTMAVKMYRGKNPKEVKLPEGLASVGPGLAQDGGPLRHVFYYMHKQAELDEAEERARRNGSKESMQSQGMNSFYAQMNMPSSIWGNTMNPMSVMSNPAMISNQNMGMPTQNMAMANQNMAMPTQNMAMPTQNMAIPNQNMAIPNQNMAIPNQNMGISNQNMGIPNQNMGMPNQMMNIPNQNMGISNMQNVNAMGMPINNTGANAQTNAFNTMMQPQTQQSVSVPIANQSANTGYVANSANKPNTESSDSLAGMNAQTLMKLMNMQNQMQQKGLSIEDLPKLLSGLEGKSSGGPNRGTQRNTVDKKPDYIPDRGERGGEEPRGHFDERPRKPKSDLISVYNLPPEISTTTVHEKFSEVGPVKFVDMTGPGSAIVRFISEWDAERAIKMYHGARVNGYPLEVNYF